MTKDEWIGSQDAWAMLVHLNGSSAHRKLRLFAVGCCRQIWDSIEVTRCRRAVEASERYADNKATLEELQQARKLAYHAVPSERGPFPSFVDVLQELRFTADVARPPSDDWAIELGRIRLIPELKRLAPGLLRCVFGLDRGHFFPIDGVWLNPHAIALAQSIYEGQCFHLLPILGDALEEAGCDDQEILSHCRGEGPHVRGCWVVDLILGKS